MSESGDREAGPDRPSRVDGARSSRTVRDWLQWLWHTDRTAIAISRELVVSILVVLLLAGMLYGVSGVWPPLVAVESDSMEPQIMTGDLVFIVEPDRFADAQAVAGTGVVPAEQGTALGYTAFNRAGDVIIYAPQGDENDTPIIHRAHLWVNEGDDWVERADPDLLGADGCDGLESCPAPHDGFITHGDNNPTYDQVQDGTSPIKPEWVIARAQYRIPLVGYIRLLIADILEMIVAGHPVA